MLTKRSFVIFCQQLAFGMGPYFDGYKFKQKWVSVNFLNIRTPKKFVVITLKLKYVALP